MSKYTITDPVKEDFTTPHTKELLVSGYGNDGNTMKLLSFTQDLTFTPIFEQQIPNCSFCATSPNGEYLFGLEEHTQEGTSVYMFKKENGQYRKLDKRHLEGKGLCHITYVPNNNILLGAFYFSGNVFCLTVTEFGFGELTTNIYQGKDEGITGKAHCCYVSENQKNMYCANIEQDRIYKYLILDKYIILDHYITLIAGTGPRHIVENGSHLYVMTEYSNEVVVIDNSGDRMSVIQRISTLFDGYSESSFGSTLALSKDKKHLYTANRGADTIAMFATTPAGLLVEDGYYTTIGKNPRHIALLNDDKNLAIMCQDSDIIYFYDRDLSTGKLTKNPAILAHKSPSFAVQI